VTGADREHGVRMPLCCGTVAGLKRLARLLEPALDRPLSLAGRSIRGRRRRLRRRRVRAVDRPDQYRPEQSNKDDRCCQHDRPPRP
jgi:hypothetical protein